MPDVEFVDTNVWVYAHLDDAAEPRSAIAWRLTQSLHRPVISPQVVAEYHNVMRRNGRDDPWLERNIERMLAHCRLHPLDLSVVRRTIALRNRFGFSFWDCQIVAAALESGCTTLYTEDLQHGQTIDGLVVTDPFQ